MLLCCQGWLNPYSKFVKQPRSISCLIISPVSELAISIPLKLWMSLWLEPWNGEGKGDVGLNTPLEASGFVSVEKGQSLGGQKHKWYYEKQRKAPYCYGQSSHFFPVLWPLNECCSDLGAFRTERFVHLCCYILFCQYLLVCGNKPLCKQTKSTFCFDSQDIKSHVESKKQFAMWHRVSCPAVIGDLYPNKNLLTNICLKWERFLASICWVLKSWALWCILTK